MRGIITDATTGAARLAATAPALAGDRPDGRFGPRGVQSVPVSVRAQHAGGQHRHRAGVYPGAGRAWQLALVIGGIMLAERRVAASRR